MLMAWAKFTRGKILPKDEHIRQKESAMKQANLYKLKVSFSTGHGWNLSVLAMSANDALSFVNKGNESDNIKIESVELKLIATNHTTVKENFCARILQRS